MLELLGAAFLIILGCVFIGGMSGVFWMRGKMRDATVVDALRDSLKEVKPANLEAADDELWHHPAEAHELCKEFLSAGAESVGRFSIPEIDNIQVHAFTHQDPPLYITVNDHPKYACWTDVVMLPEKGGSVTLTTVAAGSVSVPRPAQHELEKLHVSTHPTSMFGYARSRCLDDTFKPVSAEEFVPVFDGIMADCQNALMSQDIDQDWLESVASGSGIELVGDEAETINTERQLERHELIVSECLQRYVKDLGVSAESWEAQRAELLVVYESVPDWLLVEQLYERLPVPREFEQELVDIESDGKPPRVSARQFMKRLPAGDSIEHLATLSEPMVADIYRVPASSEPLRDAA